MKAFRKLTLLALAACFICCMTVFAAEDLTYSDETGSITVSPDHTFVMTKGGESMDGAAFLLTVKGTVGEDGKVAITGLFDGDLDLTQMASEDQLAADLATAQALYDAAASQDQKDKAPVKAAPGEYTDGSDKIVIAEDDTFVVATTGQNMEGNDFELKITGTIAEDGTLSISGIFDGEFDLTQLASEEQLAEDLKTVQALYAIALEETKSAAAAGSEGKAGIYKDDTSVLEIAEDGTFVLTTTGRNMEGNDFELTVKGTVTDGKFEITGIFDGEFDLTQLASPEQIADNLATLEALYQAGK